MIERKVRLSWTTWTFGVWYGRIGRKPTWGIDLGPLAVVWQKKRVRR